MRTTLPDLLASIAANATAVIIPEQTLRVSYGALRHQVQTVAEALVASGLRRGDRIGIALPNGLPAIVSLLAASTVGTAAPLNPGYKEAEFRFYLEDTGARVLLLPSGGMDEARRAADGRIPILAVDMDASGTVHLVGGSGTRTVIPPATDDIALVLHTSGSTGRPKRVPLTHANLCISAANVARTYALGSDDVSLCVMPLFHVHGLVASTLATFATGGTLVVPGKFNPLSFWRVASEYGMTWYSAVPTVHQMLLDRVEAASTRPAGARTLRFIRSCSAPLLPQVMRDLEASFGVPVLEAYGMTEAAHQIASNPLPPGPRRAGSVGCGTDVRISIMDANGQHLPAGQRGEVVVEGPNITRGYENDPDANAASFMDGWFRTGDLGILDADGHLTLVGRLKEQINRGGEKISPREIDEILLAHPAIAEAVCFGVAHRTWGEDIEAAVVLRQTTGSRRATESELMTFCKERLADYKRPTQIHIVDAIPRTATGKIQRRVVAAALAQRTV